MGLRLRFAVVLNIVLPGSGLILARKHWSGLAWVVLFTTATQIVLWSLWVAPGAIPHWTTTICLGGVAALWVTCQVKLVSSIRVLTDPTRHSQIQTCYELFDQATKAGRYDEARGALDVALTVDDENPDTYARLARLTALVGKYDEARQAWRVVDQLDHRGIFRREMTESLSRFPYRAEA